MSKVRVVGHYRVLHNGQAFTAGDGVVEVPDQVAKRWALYGWAEPVEQSEAEQPAEQVDDGQAEQVASKPKRSRRS